MENKVVAFILVGLTLLGLVSYGATLQCYLCNNGDDPECAHGVFNSSGKVKMTTQQCNETAGENKCMKIVTVAYGKGGDTETAATVTSRFCSREEYSDQCWSQQGSNGGFRACLCSDMDGCNGAAGMVPWISSILVLALMCGLVNIPL